MSDDLPPMSSKPDKFEFNRPDTKSKKEEVKPEKRTKSNVHLRAENVPPVSTKKFVCKGLDKDCTFDTDHKSAYTNHIKTHKPDILSLYAGDLVQIWLPFGAGKLQWDIEKSIYVSPNQIKIPDGFELFRLTNRTRSETIPDRTGDGAIRTVTFQEVIIKRVQL